MSQVIEANCPILSNPPWKGGKAKYRLGLKPINLDDFKNKKLFALAGIGNPENFFQLIEENNLKIMKKFIYPDHYKFSINEIQDIMKEAENDKAEIIMTEKDYYKLKNFKLNKLNFLKVSLEIVQKNELLKIIKKKI